MICGFEGRVNIPLVSGIGKKRHLSKIRNMFFSLGFQLKDMAFLRDQLLGVSLAVGRLGMDHKSGHW